MTKTTTRKIAADKKSGKAVEGEIRAVAKSLHSITVIKQVALLHMVDGASPELGVLRALDTLGLTGRPDPYGLAATALKQLKAEAK